MPSDADEPRLTQFHHLGGVVEAGHGELPLVDLEVGTDEGWKL